MTWETHSVTPDRFEDFADVINRTRRTAARAGLPCTAHPGSVLRQIACRSASDRCNADGAPRNTVYRRPRWSSRPPRWSTTAGPGCG